MHKDQVKQMRDEARAKFDEKNASEAKSAAQLAMEKRWRNHEETEGKPPLPEEQLTPVDKALVEHQWPDGTQIPSSLLPSDDHTGDADLDGLAKSVDGSPFKADRRRSTDR